MNFDFKDIDLFQDKIEELPTLPTIAVELLDLLGNPSASMTQISRVMQVDPSITAKVLKIANSAYYSLRKKVDNLRMALVVLGISEVRNIILSLSLFKTTEKEEIANFDQQIFWYHSATVAHLTKFLASKFGFRTHGEEFTAGLLHDIGKILISEHLPQKFEEIISILEQKKCVEYLAERRVIGWSHYQIGAWLATEWKIPSSIIDVILYHHFPELDPEKNTICPLVQLADFLAHKYGKRQVYQQFSVDDNITLCFESLKAKGINYTLADLEDEILIQMDKANSFFTTVFGQ